jgi:hypothetical protein
MGAQPFKQLFPPSCIAAGREAREPSNAEPSSAINADATARSESLAVAATPMGLRGRFICGMRMGRGGAGGPELPATVAATPSPTSRMATPTVGLIWSVKTR